jgi:hypothetical protein
MGGMGAARRAEFLDRQFVRLLLLVLGRGVVAAFATVAGQRYQVSHFAFFTSISINSRTRTVSSSVRREAHRIST